MQHRIWVWGAAILATVAGFGVWLDGQSSLEASPEGNAQRLKVRAAAVSAAPANEERWFQSTVRAADQAVVSFTTGGRLLERPVEVGQRVEPGVLLAVLDRAPQRNMLAAAQADSAQLQRHVDQLQRDLTRAKNLQRDGATSPEEVEQITSQLQATRAALRGSFARSREARRQFGETSLRAPFAGTVSRVMLEPGEFAGPGAPVLYLQGDAALEVELSVPERLVGGLRVGDEVKVQFPLVELPPRQGTIQELARATGGMGGLFTVVVNLGEPVTGSDTDAALRPGMTAAVAITRPVQEAIAVPMAALIDPTGASPRVFRVEGSQARAVDVQIGRPIGDVVTILADELEPGDAVVVAGHIGLVSGAAVEVSR